MLGGHPTRQVRDGAVVVGKSLRDCLQCSWGQLDEEVPAVGGVLAAVHPPRLLETVDEHGDRSRGKAQAVAKVALGERPVCFEVFECVEIGGADPGTARKGSSHTVPREPEVLEAAGQLLGTFFHSPKYTQLLYYLVTKLLGK